MTIFGWVARTWSTLSQGAHNMVVVNFDIVLQVQHSEECLTDEEGKTFRTRNAARHRSRREISPITYVLGLAVTNCR
jgi:hypothetical protein